MFSLIWWTSAFPLPSSCIGTSLGTEVVAPLMHQIVSFSPWSSEIQWCGPSLYVHLESLIDPHLYKPDQALFQLCQDQVADLNTVGRRLLDTMWIRLAVWWCELLLLSSHDSHQWSVLWIQAHISLPLSNSDQYHCFLYRNQWNAVGSSQCEVHLGVKWSKSWHDIWSCLAGL